MKLVDLGDPAPMIAACGDNGSAKVTVLLLAGRIAEAEATAKVQLIRSAMDPKALGQALKDMARCFRGYDLSLVRANRYLDYNRTGEGENPLPGFEKELKAGAAGAPKP